MSAIEVRPVTTSSEHRTFLTFPWRIYRGDPLWVPPLLPERAKTIDPQRGVFFKRGEAECFIAWRDGKPVGTILAADDRVTNEQRHLHDCLIGFFECIDDYAVAQALFAQAAAWGQQRGLDALYGPFNLDYEDGYGVQIEGYDRPPVVFCGHTPPYYRRFFEDYGFEPARGSNLAFAVTLEDRPSLQHLSRLAEHVRRKGHIYVRGGDLAHWEDEVDRIFPLFNAALAHLPDYIPWTHEAFAALLEPFRQIVDPDLILFAEVEGRVVGWFPGIPNLNEAFIHVNGLRYPWDYARLAWYLRHKTECLAVKSVLVYPEYWDTGVSVLLFDEMVKRTRAKGYKWLDLSLTSDDNPYTPHLAERFDAKLYKRYQVYRVFLTTLQAAGDHV